MNQLCALINIDNIEDIDEIYTDFIDNDFSEVPHLFRPGYRWQIHTEWENELSKVIAELAEPPVEISQPSSDLRPHMYNQLAGQLILLDTGAATSIWPASA